MIGKGNSFYIVVTIIALVHGNGVGDLNNGSSITCKDVEAMLVFEAFMSIDEVTSIDISELRHCLENRTTDNSTFLTETLRSGVNISTNSSTDTTQGNKHGVQSAKPQRNVIFDRFLFITGGIYFPICSIVGFIGNILAIVVLCKGYMKSNSYVYLLALAIANAIFLAAYFVRVFNAYPSIKLEKWYIKLFAIYMNCMSHVVATIQTFRVLVIICFTVERFIAVVFPLKAQIVCTLRRAKTAIALSFVISIALNFVRIFTRKFVAKVDPLTGEHYYTFASTELARGKLFSAIFYWCFLICTDIAPFLILLFLNSAIIHRLWRARLTRVNLVGTSEGKTREAQITHLLVSIVIAFFVCNSPACVSSILVAINGRGFSYPPQIYYLFSLSNTMYNTNPMLNCIMYVVCNTSMRTGLMSIICSCRNVKTNTPKTPLQCVSSTN